MESHLWKHFHGRSCSGTGAPAFPVGEVPMKGVILANRKTIFHKTRVCPRMSMGVCHLGTKCSFAHTLEELRPAPNLDRTKLCPSVLQPGTICPAQIRGEPCRFAHSKAEIRHTSNMFKTNMCLKWIRGKCKKDLQCNHAHGHQELKYYRSLAMVSGSRDFARESEATLSRRRKQAAAPAAASSGASQGLSAFAEMLCSSQQQRQQQKPRSDCCESLREADYQASSLCLLTGSSATGKHPPKSGNNTCTSVNRALAALYEELLRCRRKGEAWRLTPRKPLNASLHDDSSIATDETADFSSFSSRCLSDALRSAASTAASLGSSLHPAELETVQATAPALAVVCQESNSCSENSSGSYKGSELLLNLDQLLLLKMLAGKAGCALDGHHGALGDVPVTAAAAPNAAGSCMVPGTSVQRLSAEVEALESGLAKLYLADPRLRQPCLTDLSSSGFERKPQQQQQHAVVDLDRLADNEDFD